MPSTVVGTQLIPSVRVPSIAKKRSLCDARNVSIPVDGSGLGHRSRTAAAMLDLPEQLGPLRTMQAAATDQGSANPPRITALAVCLIATATPRELLRSRARGACLCTGCHGSGRGDFR